MADFGSICRIHGSGPVSVSPLQLPTEDSVDDLCKTLNNWHHCPELYKAIEAIRFIADHTKREDDSNKVTSLIDRNFSTIPQLCRKSRSPIVESDWTLWSMHAQTILCVLERITSQSVKSVNRSVVKKCDT